MFFVPRIGILVLALAILFLFIGPWWLGFGIVAIFDIAVLVLMFAAVSQVPWVLHFWGLSYGPPGVKK